jgi:hypothetical protein
MTSLMEGMFRKPLPPRRQNEQGSESPAHAGAKTLSALLRLVEVFGERLAGEIN